MYWLTQTLIGVAIAVGYVALIYGIAYFSMFMAGEWPAGSKRAKRYGKDK